MTPVEDDLLTTLIRERLAAPLPISLQLEKPVADAIVRAALDAAPLAADKLAPREIHGIIAASIRAWIQVMRDADPETGRLAVVKMRQAEERAHAPGAESFVDAELRRRADSRRAARNAP